MGDAPPPAFVRDETRAPDYARWLKVQRWGMGQAVLLVHGIDPVPYEPDECRTIVELGDSMRANVQKRSPLNKSIVSLYDNVFAEPLQLRGDAAGGYVPQGFLEWADLRVKLPRELSDYLRESPDPGKPGPPVSEREAARRKEHGARKTQERADARAETLTWAIAIALSNPGACRGKRGDFTGDALKNALDRLDAGGRLKSASRPETVLTYLREAARRAKNLVVELGAGSKSAER